ncbi:histone-lysine N-methyltransferase SETMAR [Trichonephila clavipes]|nr:histone-lysine N-methyltransferase SETMAR [Trichonephila clavipes]
MTRPGKHCHHERSHRQKKVDDLVAILEGVCRLGSEAVHRPAKGTAYGTSTATSVSVSGRPAFMKRIVTGDETWCHHYEPETKRDSMQWKHASSPPPKKFRAVKSAGKVLLTVFFDVQGPLLVEFLEHRKALTPMCTSHINGTGHVQMGDVGPSTLQSGHVTLQFPCVWSTEETPGREALQLGRRTQGHCEGLGLVTATGILGTRNPAACSSVGSLYLGLWCIF